MEELRLSRPVVKGVNCGRPKLVSTQTANGGGEGQPLAARTSPTATAIVGYRIPARPICLAQSINLEGRENGLR